MELGNFSISLAVKDIHAMGGAVYLTHKDTRYMRLKHFLTTLAGPMANGFMILTGWSILRYTEKRYLWGSNTTRMIRHSCTAWPWPCRP
jgi:hypothetical protein